MKQAFSLPTFTFFRNLTRHGSAARPLQMGAHLALLDPHPELEALTDGVMDAGGVFTRGRRSRGFLSLVLDVRNCRFLWTTE